MTYPPGGPGYPTTQQPSQYTAPTQQFERPPDSGVPSPQGASKLPLYLGGAVAALGLAGFLASFGPLLEYDVPKGSSPSATAAVSGFGGGFLTLIIPTLLAGLLAGVGLLPKQAIRSGVVTVLAVLGLLLLLSTVVGGGSFGWGFYLFFVFSVLQSAAALWHLLLDAGIVTAPTPRSRPEASPYGAYGQQPPQYYGQPSYGAPGGPSQHQPGYQPQSQYGGYQGGAPGTGGFPALNRPGGPPNGPQNGPPTPPTGFPAFGHPQQAAPSAGDSQGNSTAQQPSQQSAPPPS